jgi:hypothetical protein
LRAEFFYAKTLALQFMTAPPGNWAAFFVAAVLKCRSTDGSLVYRDQFG